MKKGKLYVLNTPILTGYGVYGFERISKEEATKLLKENEFISAVGHKGTAEVMSELLGVEIPVNRVRVEMEEGDTAIVFRVLVRLEEGKVLSKEELERLPHELGILCKYIKGKVV